MEQVLTIVCKLNPTKEIAQEIEATLFAFADACNYANEQVKPNITSKTTIQNMVYQTLREKFGLSANLAVRACARVGANRKTAKLKNNHGAYKVRRFPLHTASPVKKFAPTSADYDARIFAYREKDESVSLTLLSGRYHIPLDIGNYQRGKLKGRNPTSAQLCKHRDGKYYIHIQVKDEPQSPISSNKVIGVDFGRTDIAVTSNNQKWSGKQITQVRDKYSKIRASLQKKASKGTRSSRRRCRRLVKLLSMREKRFQAWVNHNISKTIINQALKSNALVSIEDLTGIRDRTNQKPRSKRERRLSNSWSFYQLRSFLEYKGIKYGVEVLAVPPQYTSQTCYRCLHIGLRSAKSFKCVNSNCLWHGDADWNGSLMIQALGLSVRQPEGSRLFCSLDRDDSGLLKAIGLQPA
ncbi:transposase, IS605 OrfB family [Stanieria cyanosphaera PCC 7437]|uniref:Transposase, IS605 OrfB family n=1 Tax=Stanieria cyanosphaera (strain ATCC 29371 / PCC 7437) TaxID=111780 RepID=K9XYD9_STAC7|nr:RNA-guided endonuclease TnpB family protein [Stanieria cyanosphaera]AFZ36682.1 transposase, IS605 OrfB family [Stanieria cyanosphaera PCC 7437]